MILSRRNALQVIAIGSAAAFACSLGDGPGLEREPGVVDPKPENSEAIVGMDGASQPPVRDFGYREYLDNLEDKNGPSGEVVVTDESKKTCEGNPCIEKVSLFAAEPGQTVEVKGQGLIIDSTNPRAQRVAFLPKGELREDSIVYLAWIGNGGNFVEWANDHIVFTIPLGLEAQKGTLTVLVDGHLSNPSF